MGDSISDVLQELSGLLRRITEQNDASWKLRKDSDSRKEQSKVRVEEISSNTKKKMDINDELQVEDVQFQERLLQILDQHNQLLESLIARLKDSSKKGPI